MHGNVRLIGVVLGASNGGERDTNMASLLDAGFEQEGVPDMRPEPRRSRFPLLIASANAASLPARMRPSSYRTSSYRQSSYHPSSYHPSSYRLAMRMAALREDAPVHTVAARGVYAPRLHTVAARGFEPRLRRSRRTTMR